MTRERNALLERVERALPARHDAFERLQDRRDRRTLRRRVSAGVVGVAATASIVAGLIVWSPLVDRGAPGVAGMPLVAEPGEYYYVKVSSWGAGSDHTSTWSAWVGADGSGRTLQDSRDERFGPGEFPARLRPELSSDAGALLAQLIDRGSPQGESPNPIASSSPGRTQETTTLLRTMQDLLTFGSDLFLTPVQTAAVQQAAAGLGDVTTELNVTDPLGREATRLSWVVDYDIGAGSRVLWYFEPSTGQFMGQYWVDQRTGKIESAMWVVRAGIAPTVERVPTDAASYVPRGGEPELGPVELPSTAA